MISQNRLRVLILLTLVLAIFALPFLLYLLRDPGQLSPSLVFGLVLFASYFGGLPGALFCYHFSQNGQDNRPFFVASLISQGVGLLIVAMPFQNLPEFIPMILLIALPSFLFYRAVKRNKVKES
jgi:hypothetical protein